MKDKHVTTAGAPMCRLTLVYHDACSTTVQLNMHLFCGALASHCKKPHVPQTHRARLVDLYPTVWPTKQRKAGPLRH